VATTSPRLAARSGPDRLTVYLLSLAAFLAVLALMATQLRAAPGPKARPLVVVRRVYETRVLETDVGPARGAGGVTQSVSSSGSTALPAATPATRAS
jgi:hypothetical protein